MRLCAVSLENFRSYRERKIIPINGLTAFIGRNDAGKSTVLEALDIFFEGGTVKIDPGDASIDGESARVRIGAIFSDLPAQLSLDSGSATTLEAEHLLNADGLLEITKQYNCSVSTTVGSPKIFAQAMHPSNPEANNLLQKKNNDLKAIVRDRGLEAECQLNNNPSMRQALYRSVEDLALQDQEVSLKDADAKDIWEAVKRQLPVFVLFQSDRASSDQDREVQDPLKLAVKKALAEVAQDLDAIAGKVKEKAEATARRTLEQMQKAYPEIDLASELDPQVRKPKWDSLFKLDLESDSGIPLNKRGSGVRRLVLLSFFQAEAERLRKERAEGENNVPVIYAIEEPETSQHPDHQEKIIEAFREIAASGDQVLLTTHVPALAGLLPENSIRFVDRDPVSGAPRLRAGSTEVLEQVAESLGVSAFAITNLGAKVAVAVEGPTDILALRSFASVLSNAGVIQEIDHSKVFWTICGGSTLKDFVERRYLDSLNIPQIYIFDSDRTAENLPPRDRATVEKVSELNSRANCKAFLSRKRTIENYIHMDAVSRLSDGKILIADEVDPDFGNIAVAFGEAFGRGKEAHDRRLGFEPVDHDGNPLEMDSKGKGKCKRVLTAFVMRNMTSDEVLERGRYFDEASGEEGNEILEWLEAIIDQLDS